MEKKKSYLSLLILPILLVITLIIGVVGVTYAYYRFQVVSTNISSLTITATNLELQYNESLENISGTNIIPGWSDTKSFSVYNTANAPAHYSILWTNITNNFVNKDYLEYSLVSTAGNGCSKTNTIFPSATSEICRAVIDGKETQSYTLTINYLDSSTVNLASDMGMNFAGTITVEGLSNDELYTITTVVTNGSITKINGTDVTGTNSIDVRAVPTGEVNQTIFTLSPTSGTCSIASCTGSYRSNPVLSNNVLTVTGISSDVQCSVTCQ